MRALALILLVAVVSSAPAGDEKTVLATGDWSEATNGLRGRLILAQGGGKLGDGKARETLLYVEVENVDRTASGAVHVHFDPDALACELTDADGKAVPQTPVAASGGRPAKAWVVIPFDSSLRLRANPFGFGRPEGLLIHLNTASWQIKGDGEYRLSGTLDVRPPDGHGRTDAWKGALKMPPLKVRAADLRPSVTDAKSGITVSVQEDGRTIVARTKDGKVAWEADVIKAADQPAVDEPVVRALRSKDGKLTAVFGKHSFAHFDLTTGKFLGAGSD